MLKQKTTLKPADLLVVVGNITDKQYTGSLVVDTPKLFGERPKDLVAFDAYDEKKYPVQGNRINLNVNEKDYVLLRIQAKEQ